MEEPAAGIRWSIPEAELWTRAKNRGSGSGGTRSHTPIHTRPRLHHPVSPPLQTLNTEGDPQHKQ